MKRFAAILLVLLFTLTAVPPVSAATPEEQSDAQELYSLGLLQGVSLYVSKQGRKGDPVR